MALAMADVCVFPKRVAAMLTPRRVVVAALSLCAGALPLIYFNVVTGGATLRTGQVMSDPAPIAQKLLVLRKTMSGNVLFAWLTDETQPAIRRCSHGNSVRSLRGNSAG